MARPLIGKVHRSLLLCAVLAVSGAVPAFGQAAQGKHSFVVSGKRFLLDGRPYQVISGEMHYPRIPRAYWRARLRMAKAMGLNTITTYVFWNVHEPRPGVYDFTGQNDVAEFIREAQQRRPLRHPPPRPLRLRRVGVGRLSRLAPQRPLDHCRAQRRSEIHGPPRSTAGSCASARRLAPLQIGNGGPIIAVQVENEYGSFGNDHAYMEQIHHETASSTPASPRSPALHRRWAPSRIPERLTP